MNRQLWRISTGKIVQTKTIPANLWLSALSESRFRQQIASDVRQESRRSLRLNRCGPPECDRHWIQCIHHVDFNPLATICDLLLLTFSLWTIWKSTCVNSMEILDPLKWFPFIVRTPVDPVNVSHVKTFHWIPVKSCPLEIPVTRWETSRWEFKCSRVSTGFTKLSCTCDVLEVYFY